MIYPLKFRSSSEGQVFFFSDFHHSHASPNWPIPLWKQRGFSSVEEHDKTLTERWNKKVTNRDTVFLLGDTIVGAGAKGKEVLDNLFKVLNYSELYIMGGNHYSGFKNLFDDALKVCEIDSHYRLQCGTPQKPVYIIPNYYEIFVNYQPIVLSHYPILSFNGMNKSGWMLFGHVHGNLAKTPWVAENYLTGKVLDVGPESVKEPISFDEVKKIMDSKKVLLIDHHDSQSSTPFS